jgi:hypothetical protein
MNSPAKSSANDEQNSSEKKSSRARSSNLKEPDATGL